MLTFNDYQQYDALGLASLIRSGELSASEVLEAAIDRAEARNPDINSLVAKTYEEARATAKAPLPQSNRRSTFSHKRSRLPERRTLHVR